MSHKTFTEHLLPEIQGMHPEAILTHLARIGVLSARRCEQQALRANVEHLVRQGAGRCDAMEQVAARFYCSYAKVREAVYYKPKN